MHSTTVTLTRRWFSIPRQIFFRGAGYHRAFSRSAARVGRQRELEHCAAWLVGARPQAPLVRVDDRPADCQAHAQALGLGGVVGIKNTLEHLGGESWSGISH